MWSLSICRHPKYQLQEISAISCRVVDNNRKYSTAARRFTDWLVCEKDTCTKNYFHPCGVSHCVKHFPVKLLRIKPKCNKESTEFVLLAKIIYRFDILQLLQKTTTIKWIYCKCIIYHALSSHICCKFKNHVSSSHISSSCNNSIHDCQLK